MNFLDCTRLIDPGNLFVLLDMYGGWHQSGVSNQHRVGGLVSVGRMCFEQACTTKMNPDDDNAEEHDG
jgi:hypothetical protein